ncbi:MAG: hypothetical protein KAG66_00720, partial [Methylococcales bacterium]|nr:hypothetical protein [Methylococcales bacterium]
RDKKIDELLNISLEAQIGAAANDSLGLCIFGGTVTNPNADFLATTINNALGTSLEATFFSKLGRETLKLEASFNKAAGFDAADDDLPDFFYTEPLMPSNHTARFHGVDVHDIYND